MRDQIGDWILLTGAMDETESRLMCRIEKKEGRCQRHGYR